MKTAISIPDHLYRQADRLARRLGVSRSRLYAKAVERFVSEHDEDTVTEKLNQVYGAGGEASGLDPSLAAAQAASVMEDD